MRLFCLLAPVALLALLERSHPADAPAKPRRFALLAGVNHYPSLKGAKGDRPLHDLEGAGNDAELLASVLTRRFGFPADDEHLRVLTEERGLKDTAHLPTRANIEREFQRLARILRKGDQVVILLAGHGSQQPADWSVPDNDEPDGLDEVFLPRDTRPFDDKRERWPNAISDDQLRGWVDKIVARGALLWIVLDSCHSGTMLRTLGQERARELPIANFLAPARLARARAEGEKRSRDKGRTRALTAPGLRLRPDGPNVAAFFAAQAHETTVELPLGPGGKTYGLLTYTLCEILSKPSAQPLSYLDLMRRVQARYSALGRDFPTPLAEGLLCGRAVITFDKTLPRRPPIRLTSTARGLRIDAGRLYGLTPGSVLAVYPLEGDLRKAPLGHVRVELCGAGDADVVAVAHARTKKDVKLPARALCVPVLIGLDELRLPVAVAPLTEKGERLSPKDVAAVRAVLRKLSTGPGAVCRLVEEPAGPWLVGYEALGKRALCLWPPDRGSAAQVGMPGPGGEAWLRERLGRAQRAANLLRCATTWKDSEPTVADAEEATRVRLEVRRSKGPRDNEGEALPPGARPIFRSGERVLVRVTNLGRWPVDVNLLHINSDQRITSLYPRKGGATNNRLSSGHTLTKAFRLAGGKGKIERWVLIAVRARKLSQNVDFLYLEQAGLDDANRSLTRGGERGAAAPLDRFLLEALFPVPAGRRDAADVSDNCALEVFEYRLGL